MAIDTRDKRASVVFSAIRVGWPLADGTIDADDRRHISGGYRGITTGGAPAIGPYAVYPADVAFPYTEANWTNGSWYHEVTMRIASGTIYSRLWDATGSALVAGGIFQRLPAQANGGLDSGRRSRVCSPIRNLNGRDRRRSDPAHPYALCVIHGRSRYIFHHH